MAVRPEEITSIIKEQIQAFGVEAQSASVGTVVEAGDGIARIHGLSGAKAGELLEFRDGIMGLALNLEEEAVGAVILGDYTTIAEGDEVRTTGRIAEVPVGAQLIGRVVNALGQPIDGKGPIATTKTRAIERIAPNVVSRRSVDTPVQTGIKPVDAMIPIGRGQRELIIGDRNTGKTAIAIDTIINQKGGDLICVYVAVRPESLESGPGRWRAGGGGRNGAHHRRERQRIGIGGAAIPCPLRRLRHGRGVHGGGQGRPHHLR